MIVKGSLNYSPNGRKRKKVKRVNKQNEFKELKTYPTYTKGEHYMSRLPRVHATAKSRPIQGNRATIAIAYNKGAYQVIPESDIKYIGK